MIVLEAGINHFGKIKEAKKILNFFLKSEIKYLTFMVHTSKFYKKFRKKINFKLPNSFYQRALDLAHKKKKKIGLAVCDPESYRDLKEIKFDFYKLLSIAINNKKLIAQIDKTKKKIYISLGKGSNLKIKNCIKKFSNKKKLNLLYTSMSHLPSDINLNRIKKIKKKFNLRTGYGHHYRNDSPLIMSSFFSPSFLFFYVKNRSKNKKRVFPDDKHAFFTDEVNTLISKIRESKEFTNSKKINFKIKINEIKNIRY